MNKNLTALLAACLVWTGAMAQSVSKQINDIKRDKHYLCAEGTMDTEAQAYELAEELLTKQISEYASTQKQLKNAANVIVKDVAGKAEKLLMNRGTMVRVFLYVKKDDIMAADNTRVLVQPQKTAPGNAPAATKTNTKEVVSPTAKAVVEARGEAGEGDASLRLASAWQQAVVDELLACPDATKAHALLSRLRTERKVKRFGPADSCPNPAACLWLVFGDDESIVTVLGEGQSERTNFRTLTKDSLSNYPGMGAIWFTLAK